ncbi:class I SAM-dependent methyltransferase [Micromonospora chokoriensis]
MTTTNTGRVRPPQMLALLDPTIQRELDRLEIRPGQRVLEVGAGIGETTARLARLVGPNGKVAAVDIDNSLLGPTNVIDVYPRNLDGDELPGDPGTFDLAVARWPHGTVPDPADVIRQMIDRLRPGGWLILADLPWNPIRVYYPQSEATALIEQALHWVYGFLGGPGTRSTWPKDITGLLVANGLNPVCVHQNVETWTGGGPGCGILIAAIEHLRPELLDHGLSPTDIDQVAALLHDPSVVLGSLEHRAVHARKPL